MEVKNKLQEAINKYAIMLPQRAWVFEADRWENLIFSIIRQYRDDDPQKAGIAVNILRDWNLLDIDELSAEDRIPLEFNSAFKKILLGLDFGEEDIQKIAKALVKIAKEVKSKYDGRIQVIMREYGELIRNELIASFSDDELDNDKIEQGVSLWLQSAFGLPILSEKKVVTEFCEDRGINLEGLTTIADEMDLNLGVMDYFIERSQLIIP